jgi:uncharacterized SAM-binding protein YcdF (DUF218 family)
MSRVKSATTTGERVFISLLLVIWLFTGIAFLRFSGRMLVLDQPARADVILVLNGDSNDVRFWRAVNLQRAGYLKTVLVDERTDTIQFGRTQAELAQDFIARLQLANVQVCPGRADSTAQEAEFVEHCLALHAQRILLVTSDYHTRRALATFRHRLPEYQWSVAAASDPSVYGADWWRNRKWTKNWFLEAQKLVWWELVDRWRILANPTRVMPKAMTLP